MCMGFYLDQERQDGTHIWYILLLQKIDVLRGHLCQANPAIGNRCLSKIDSNNNPNKTASGFRKMEHSTKHAQQHQNPYYHL